MGNGKTAFIIAMRQSHGYALQNADYQILISYRVELVRSDHSVALISLFVNTRKSTVMLKASSMI